MRLALVLATALISIGSGQGAAYAADGCGPGCHNAVNGGCVVDGWESGAVRWNECPAGAHPRPPCAPNYSWVKQARTCQLVH